MGLIGFVLLVWGSMAVVGSLAVQFGVQAAVISNEQLAQVPAYALSDTIQTWSLIAGEIVFGISIYRAQVFPKYAGAFLALVGILHELTGLLDFTIPIYIICSFVAYAWLGWILLTDKSLVSQERGQLPHKEFDRCITLNSSVKGWTEKGQKEKQK